MMKSMIVLMALVATALGQNKPQDIVYAPIPYSFNYLSNMEDGGSSSHQESGDGSGIVRGTYTVENLEGHTRVVEYEAGPEGFKAFIRTNEPGMDNSSPANVVIESTAPEARGPVVNYNNEAPRYAPPVASAVPAGQRPKVRYVMVPSTDPRAAGRGQN